MGKMGCEHGDPKCGEWMKVGSFEALNRKGMKRFFWSKRKSGKLENINDNNDNDNNNNNNNNNNIEVRLVQQQGILQL